MVGPLLLLPLLSKTPFPLPSSLARKTWLTDHLLQEDFPDTLPPGLWAGLGALLWDPTGTSWVLDKGP